MTTTPLCVSPWSTVDKAAIFELKAFLVGSRYSRNVLYARAATKAGSNLSSEHSAVLDPPADVNAPIPWEFKATPGNSATALSSSQPVDVTIRNEAGDSFFPDTTLMLLTSPIVKIVIRNKGSIKAEIVLVHI